jgi:hypothetical protein
MGAVYTTIFLKNNSKIKTNVEFVFWEYSCANCPHYAHCISYI